MTLLNSKTELLKKPDISLILDMTFDQLNGVNDDYQNPETVPEILWVTENSSYAYKGNGESGVFDFIFNLKMLDEYISKSTPPKHIIKQLRDLRNKGVSYILFNQNLTILPPWYGGFFIWKLIINN